MRGPSPRWSKPSHPVRQPPAGRLFRLEPPEPEYVAAGIPEADRERLLKFISDEARKRMKEVAR